MVDRAFPAGDLRLRGRLKRKEDKAGNDDNDGDGTTHGDSFRGGPRG